MDSEAKEFPHRKTEVKIIKNILITPEDVIQILNEICETDGNTHIVDPNTPILDGENNLDSMNLVQLCIVLEEKSSSFGFDFDWTSETVSYTHLTLPTKRIV